MRDLTAPTEQPSMFAMSSSHRKALRLPPSVWRMRKPSSMSRAREGIVRRGHTGRPGKGFAAGATGRSFLSAIGASHCRRSGCPIAVNPPQRGPGSSIEQPRPWDAAAFKQAYPEQARFIIRQDRRCLSAKSTQPWERVVTFSSGQALSAARERKGAHECTGTARHADLGLLPLVAEGRKRG